MKHIKIGFVLLFLALWGGWGCAGPHYYDLYIPPAPVKNAPQIDKILKVEDLWATQDLWRQNMVVRRSSYVVRYYPFKQWAKSPEKLIKDSVIRYFKNSFFFKRVVDENSSVEADILLRIRVDALEMLLKENGWHAHLALDCEFIDPEKEKTILFHSFDRTKELKSGRPKYLPGRISKILEEELLKIIDKLNIYYR